MSDTSRIEDRVTSDELLNFAGVLYVINLYVMAEPSGLSADDIEALQRDGAAVVAMIMAGRGVVSDAAKELILRIEDKLAVLNEIITSLYGSD